MRTFFVACFLLFSNFAYANGDILENVFGDNIVYNDNRRKTVIKKVYPTKTIVKEVRVPVPVQTALPPVAVVPQTMQVGRLPTARVPVVASTVPVAPPYVPVCRMVKTEAVIDQFGNVLDYIYTRVCQ